MTNKAERKSAIVERYKTDYQKVAGKSQLRVSRRFKAPLDLVWRAWTEAELLDQWWAPRPYQAITKSMDFKQGGFWLYCMKGPEGDVHWCRADYLSVADREYFTVQDAFCDESGEPNSDIPSMHWKNVFHSEENETRVAIEVTFENEQALETIVKMGFKEGFTAAHDNLDELLATI